MTIEALRESAIKIESLLGTQYKTYPVGTIFQLPDNSLWRTYKKGFQRMTNSSNGKLRAAEVTRFNIEG